MNIRKKISISLFVAITLFIAFLYWNLSAQVTKNYLSLEDHEAAQDVDVAMNTLWSEVDRLDTIDQDYGGWDDAVTFVENHNQEFLDSNFPDENFASLRLNFAAVTDGEGKLIFSKLYDWRTNEKEEVPADLIKEIESSDSLFRLSAPDKFVRGFIIIAGDPYIITGRPVITSEKKGPVRGTMIMGRELDKEYVASLSQRVSQPFTLANIDELMKTGGEEIKAADPMSFAGAIMVSKIDSAEMIAHSHVKDIYGNMIFGVTMDLQRTVFQEGQNMLSLFLIVLTGMGITLIFFVYMLMERLVVSPLVGLSKALESSKRLGVPKLDVKISSKDEIGYLSNELKMAFQAIGVNEKKLKDSNARIDGERRQLEAILQSIGDGVFVIDRSGKIILLNHRIVKYSGYKEEELLGKDFQSRLKMVLEKDRTDMAAEIRKVCKKVDLFIMDKPTLLLGKGGKEIPVHYSAAAIKNKRNETVGCVVVLRDVTKERLIDKAKSEFVSIASHQLRTPLTGIKWMIDLLQKEQTGKLNASQIEYLSNIDESNERMIKLVGDLLNISRMESGQKFVLEKSKVDLEELMDEVVKEENILARQKQVEIRLPQKWPENRFVSVDRQKMREVFRNLVNNAVKYTNSNTAVEINCRPEQDGVVVSVKDQGIGIPLGQQSRMFEKFFRADNAVATQTVGSGLGLYAVKGITEAHGGKVWFESEPEKGSTFLLQDSDVTAIPGGF